MAPEAPPPSERLLHEKTPIGHYSGNRRDFAGEYAAVEEEPAPDDARDWLQKAGDPEVQAQFARRLQERWTGRGDCVHLVGTSHLDVAWKWRFLQTVEKARVTLTKACVHLEHVPEYSFTASQPLLFEWVRRRYPALFARLQKHARGGRLELAGGSWVEPDAHMPSGEAWVRQRLYGQLFYKEHFGRYATVEWLPDTFGFATQLPQILARSNATAFYTHKLGSNLVTKFPFGTFWWEAPDGTRVLTESRGAACRRLLHPGTQASTPPFTYASADCLTHPHLSDDRNPHVILPYGKGDGGHGPTGEEVQEKLYFTRHAPNLHLTPAAAYVQHVREDCADRLPVWRDELYLEWHRGTLTTHALVKRMNRACEWTLPALELAAVLATLNAGAPYPRAALDESWRLTLLNQFHDVLPGSCIPETYDDCWDIWAWQVETHASLWSEALAALESCLRRPVDEPLREMLADLEPRGPVICFNPTAHALVLPVAVPETLLPGLAPTVAVAPSGTTGPVSSLPAIPCPEEPRYALPARHVFRAHLQPFEVTTYYLGRPRPGAQDFPSARTRAAAPRATTVEHAGGSARDIVLSNAVLRVRVDGTTGAIVSLQCRAAPGIDDGVDVRARDGSDAKASAVTDVVTDAVTDAATDAVTDAATDARGPRWMETLARGPQQFAPGTPALSPGILPRAFKDTPSEFPAWNLWEHFREHPYETRLVSARVVTHDALQVAVEVTWDVRVPDPEKWTETTTTRLRTRLSVLAGDPVLYWTAVVDMHARRATIKLDVPTATGATWVETEGAYSVDRRASRPRTPRDRERWENVMHTWVNVQAPDDAWGLALLNEGKYGVDFRGGFLGVSLLRGQAYPPAWPEAWVYEERFRRMDAGEGFQPSWTDQGPHVIRLGIYPHVGTAESARVLARAHAFNARPRVYRPGEAAKPTPEPAPAPAAGGPAFFHSSHLAWALPRVEPPVEITTVKFAEPTGERGGWASEGVAARAVLVVRAVNPTTRPVEGTLDCTRLPVVAAAECDLLERRGPAPAPVETVPGPAGASTRRLPLKWRPHEIKTVALLLDLE